MEISILDYVLIALILGLLLKEYLYKLFYKVEELIFLPLVIPLALQYSKKKENLEISDPIKQFTNTSNKCAVSNEKSMRTKFDDFKKKFHETFRDEKGFYKDIPNYREEFAELMTEIMISDHNTSKTNILGYTEFHTNVFLFKMYLNEMFKPNNRLMTRSQIVQFLEFYQRQFGENVIFKKANINFESLEEDELYNYFKQMILSDENFGLAKLMNQYISLLFEYIYLRKTLTQLLINENQDNDDTKNQKDELEKKKDELEKKVKTTYDNNTKIFSSWDKKEDDTYINYNKFLEKIQYVNDNGNITVMLNNLIRTIFQDLDKKIVKKPTFTFKCVKPSESSAEQMIDEEFGDLDYRDLYMKNI